MPNKPKQIETTLHTCPNEGSDECLSSCNLCSESARFTGHYDIIQELRQIIAKVPAEARELFVELVGASVRNRKPELFAANLDKWNEAQALMLA